MPPDCPQSQVTQRQSPSLSDQPITRMIVLSATPKRRAGSASS
jgi:hypothetical protein